MKLNGAADLQRSVEHFLCACELAEPHENLTERRERDRQAAAGAELFLQGRASFGERQGLLVTVLNQRDVGLVVTDDAENVLSLNGGGEPFGLTERRDGFFNPPPPLGQHDARQRVEERQIPPIARGMQRGRGLGDVLANDRRVAHLLVTESQLIMREADGLGVVRKLGLAKRPADQRDGARLVALGERNAAVPAPARGEQRRRKVVARGIGRTSQCGRRLRDIVGLQPGLGERAPQADFVVALEAGHLERLREHANHFGVLAALQRRLKGDGDHRGEYTTVR